jgi:5'-nucleotidase
MKRILATLTAALLLLTLAAGCGSSSSGAKDAAGGGSDSESADGFSPDKIQILVTNDDGFDADGIDALVSGLRGLDGVQVTIVAPATNQSGKGSAVTGGELKASDVKTKSGYRAKAVEGTPADTIVWAIDQKGISFTPDLVISGINAGANMGPAIELSGTVGAARAAVQRGVPALAVSQGPLVAPFDFPSGVVQVLAWFADNRSAIESGTLPKDSDANLNIPSCPTGAVRSIFRVQAASEADGYNAPVDCESTDRNPANDIGAYLIGFAPLSQIPAKATA